MQSSDAGLNTATVDVVPDSSAADASHDAQAPYAPPGGDVDTDMAADALPERSPAQSTPRRGCDGWLGTDTQADNADCGARNSRCNVAFNCVRGVYQ